MANTAIHEALETLFGGSGLSAQQADDSMSQIMQGEATPAQVGAFLAALRLKGESVDEITGCARAMKRNAVQVRPQIGDVPLIDTCGTGGDQTGTFNISTTVAFVVAGHGVKVAKHGNRSASSKCGSADVLEALGVNLNLGPEQVAHCIEEVGIGFLFAPLYHPAMRHAIGPRRELATRTVFNILGPLTNPANATHQVIGVPSPALTEPMAQVLGQMGSKAAFVVHGTTNDGRGVDELTTTGPNRISHLHEGKVTTFNLDAIDLGLARATLDDLMGGDATENAAILRGILSGEIRGPKRDVVLLNAAAALSTECGDWKAGLDEAAQSIDSGAALKVLDQFVEKTQGMKNE
jgi:anthranilate phosphoribosyltransferase